MYFMHRCMKYIANALHNSCKTLKVIVHVMHHMHYNFKGLATITCEYIGDCTIMHVRIISIEVHCKVITNYYACSSESTIAAKT